MAATVLASVVDTLASADKRLHANPGLHPEVPVEEISMSVDFLATHLAGKPRERRSAFAV